MCVRHLSFFLSALISWRSVGVGGGGSFTDKEINESWDISLTQKINSGMVWSACEKKFGADYEQLTFSWAKNEFKMVLKKKSCIV